MLEAEDYLTAAQIAPRLHIKVETVYAWAKRKMNPLPHRRVTTKTFLFSWSEVKTWVDAGGTLQQVATKRKAA